MCVCVCVCVCFAYSVCRFTAYMHTAAAKIYLHWVPKEIRGIYEAVVVTDGGKKNTCNGMGYSIQ